VVFIMRNKLVIQSALFQVGKSECPSDVECSELGGSCIECSFNVSCIYGSTVTVNCTASGNCTVSMTEIFFMMKDGLYLGHLISLQFFHNLIK
jgi:hypothetical protein